MYSFIKNVSRFKYSKQFGYNPSQNEKQKWKTTALYEKKYTWEQL